MPWTEEVLLAKLIQSAQRPQKTYEYYSRERKFYHQIKLYFNNHKEIMIRAIRHRSSYYQLTSEKLRIDKDIISEFLLKDDSSFESFNHLPDECKDNREFIVNLLKEKPPYYEFIPQIFKEDKEIIIQVLKKNPLLYSLVDDELKMEIEVIMSMIEKYTIEKNIQLIPEEMMKNVDIAMKLVTVYPRCFETLPLESRRNKKIALKAIEKDGKNYNFCEDLKDDEELFFKSIESKDVNFHPITIAPESLLKRISTSEKSIIRLLSTTPYFHEKEIFSFIPEYFFKKKSILFAALKTFPLSVKKYFNEIESKLRDEKFVVEMVSCNGFSISFCPFEMRNNKEVVMRAVKCRCMNHQHPLIFSSIEIIRNDKDFMLKLIEIDPDAVEYASINLKNDMDIILSAIERKGELLKFASTKLKDDIDIVMRAVEISPKALEFASENMRRNPEIILKVIEKEPHSFRFASNKFDERDIVVELIKRRPMSLSYCNQKFKKDEEIVMLATMEDGRILKFAHPFLMYSKKFVISALKMKCPIYNYISKELKSDRDVILHSILTGTITNYPEDIIMNDVELFIEYLKYLPSLIKKLYTNDKNSLSLFKNDREFIMKGMRKNPKIWIYFEDENYILDKEMQWLFSGYHKVIREIPFDINFKFK